MLPDLIHNVFRARAAVCPETVDGELLPLKSFKESPQRVLLMEAHIGVAVAVLYADNHVADNGHPGPVAKELLVSGLCVILLCLNELMVKVNVILLALSQLPSGQQAIEEQCVERLGRVEVIDLAAVRCVPYVFLSQLIYGSEDGVCAAGAKTRVQ